MPYEPGKCTYTESTEDIGRQQVYACLTCFRNPKNKGERNGICYSCSIQCHSDHELVELFTKRDFTCDCGTTRMASFGGCNLRKNFDSLDPPESVSNIYSHNFEGKFCDCDQSFVPEDQKGTMFQCLLGDVCLEDWFHEECILGLPLESVYNREQKAPTSNLYPEGENMLDKLTSAAEDPIGTEASNMAKIGETNTEDKSTFDEVKKTENGAKDNDDDEEEEEDNETLPGLPNIDQFDAFVCWKCIDKHRNVIEELIKVSPSSLVSIVPHGKWNSLEEREKALKKRGADISSENSTNKLSKNEFSIQTKSLSSPTSTGPEEKDVSINSKFSFSLFLSHHFRSKISHDIKKNLHSSELDKFLVKFPFFLTEEKTYEPPEDDDANSSLYEAGARALNNIPRQQAIKGLEAYDMIKERLKSFFKPFAEEGRVVTSEDVTQLFQSMEAEKRSLD